MNKIFITHIASKSFCEDLRANNINHEFIKGFTSLWVEECPKLDIVVRMVKERFGASSIRFLGKLDYVSN